MVCRPGLVRSLPNKKRLYRTATPNKKTTAIIIMSETAQNNTPAAAATAATAQPKAPCCDNPQKQAQPQPASAPAQAKGFRRQSRKQH